VLGKLQNKLRNADVCQANKVVTFKSSAVTGAAGYGVIKRKHLSYPKTKYPGTDNNNIETAMGSALSNEPAADIMESE